MARDSDDREGESPSPMEPRPGRMFHSSATGRRREQLFLTRSVFVKRLTHEMTLREVPATAVSAESGQGCNLLFRACLAQSLWHAPRACNETHHAGTLRTLGIRQLAYPGQLRGAAGEVVNQPGQLTHTSRTRPVIPQPAITRQLNKLLASIPFQRKRIRQSGYGPVLRPLAPSALHIQQSPGADPRHLSQLL